MLSVYVKYFHGLNSFQEKRIHIEYSFNWIPEPIFEMSVFQKCSDCTNIQIYFKLETLYRSLLISPGDVKRLFFFSARIEESCHIIYRKFYIRDIISPDKCWKVLHRISSSCYFRWNDWHSISLGVSNPTHKYKRREDF